MNTNHSEHHHPHGQHHNHQQPHPARSKPDTAQHPQKPQEAPINPLPKGWRREEVVKKTGIRAGKVDIIYVSNDGKKFKNKLEMQRYLGDKHDMSLLDYNTGKVSSLAIRKQKRLKNPTYQNKPFKLDNYLNLPIRQTASIFKQPVNVVTNYKNEPAKIDQQTQLKFAEKLKPVQLFWELRFNSMKAVDPMALKAGIDDEMEVENFKTLNQVGIKDEVLLTSVATSLYLNPNKVIKGQENQFMKNPRIYIDRDQPIIQSLVMNEEMVKAQESKVKELRKKLACAMSDYNLICKRKVKKEATVESVPVTVAALKTEQF